MDRSSILSFRESLRENLSGEQIEYVLDTLLLNSLEPILRVSTLIEDTLSEMMHLIVLNQRRILSVFNNAELSARIFSFIICNDHDKKLQMLKTMQLERSIYFHILKIFSTQLQPYLDHVEISLKGRKNKSRYFDAQHIIHNLKRRWHNKNHKASFFHAVKESLHWMQLAFAFRSMVIEKYVRFAHGKAMRYAHATKLTIDKDDLFKDLILSVFKATDKYRSEKGPLTAQVGWWMKDGATHSAATHEYSVAYHIPVARRRSMLARNESVQNFASPIDEKTMEQPDENLLEDQVVELADRNRVVRIMAAADKTRVAFLESGMIYPLNDDERALLRATKTKELT